MNAVTNYIGAAMLYAGAYAAFRTWKWALRPELPTAEADPTADLSLIPWSEVAAPNVFKPRQPQHRPASRQTRQAHLLRLTRQARLAKLSARCLSARTRLRRQIQAAWREGTRKGHRRMRALESRLVVLERRIERLRVMGWTEAVQCRR